MRNRGQLAVLTAKISMGFRRLVKHCMANHTHSVKAGSLKEERASKKVALATVKKDRDRFVSLQHYKHRLGSCL